MREILFRAKRRDNGEWVYGYYQPAAPAHEDIGVTLAVIGDDGYFEDIRVDPETIGQYTGLVDNNGKKIFEGDYVLMSLHDGGSRRLHSDTNGERIRNGGSNDHNQRMGL